MKKGVLLAAVVMAVAVVGTAVAAFPQDNVKLYTGCLNSGGNITYVKEGDTPLQACSSPKAVVKLSGGDITSVNTPAGSGLTGGSENGAVTLSLDAAHSLPQNCSSFEFPMKSSAGWVCASHERSTGVSLSESLGAGGGSVTYSITPEYRVKNDPDCDNGKFATGFDDDGAIKCTAPSAPSLQTFEARQANFDDGDGVPDDGDYHTYVTLPVPAGTYLVTGKGVLFQGDDDTPTFYVVPGIACRLGNLPAEYDSFGRGKDNDPDHYGFALTGVVTTTGEALTLQCSATDDLDLISVQNATLTALRVR